MASLIKHIRGQTQALDSLLGAIKRGTLPHALLFTGPSGVGKKKSAWAIAQTILCQKSHPACGTCSSCLRLERHTHESVLFIEPETLNIKASAIRKILDFVSLQSFSPARVILIESAHQMHPIASNSLLKILEEPPKNVYFILISSHLSTIMATIRSRCQIVRFPPLQEKDLLQEGKAATWMLKVCGGRMDLLQDLEEKTNLRNQAFTLLRAALNPNSKISALNELPDLVRDRKQAIFICLCWQQICRDMKMANLDETKIIHADQKLWIHEFKNLPSNILHYLFEQILLLEKDLKAYVDPVLAFDSTLLRIRTLRLAAP